MSIERIPLDVVVTDTGHRTPDVLVAVRAADLDGLEAASRGLDPTSPDTWERVAERIGEHSYTYDLSDDSHRLDVVQIVLEAFAKEGTG